MIVLSSRKHWLLVCLAMVLLLAACATPAKENMGTSESTAGSPSSAEISGKPVTVAGGEYRDVTVAELQSMLADKDFVFVNVHIPFEGNIPNTDLSIAYDEIGQHLDQLPADKSAQIVLYCRSGRMSEIAAEELVAAGYTNVWNLAGGFNAWENQGLPIEGR